MEKPSESGASEIIASVAAAYATRPDATVDDIVKLVARLTAQLGDIAPAAMAPTVSPLGTSPAPVAAPVAAPPVSTESVQPVIPLERAVTREKVYCLCCGKGFKMLKRHLGAEHGLTEEEYRQRFNLPEDMPLVAPSYSERKAKYAKSVGFGKYSRVHA